MDFPKTRRENLEARAVLLRKCNDDKTRAMTIELFHRNILFAFNMFFFTYDVRKRPLHHIPFMTWEYQDETILEIQKNIRSGKDLLLEKSRDMGATWMVLLVFLYEWLNPVGGTDFLIGSRIEDYVDRKGDMRTLFAKLRYTYYKLPKWLRPKGFNPRKHDNYMKLENPDTGAVISGESSNANFSTGGRYAGILFDEFAKWESTDESAWTAAGDASPCRIAVSTPFGVGGQYYGLVTGGSVKRIRLHWSLHPEKARDLSCEWPPPNEDDRERMGNEWRPIEKLTSPWYVAQCLRRSKVEISQELDIDYVGAGNPVFDGHAGTSLLFYHGITEKIVGFGKYDLANEKVVFQIDEPSDKEGYLTIFEKFDSTHFYTTGWDIVEGVEDGDYLVGTILDRITKNVSAVYFSQLDEVTAAKVIKATQNFYSLESDSADSPWCGIETTGPGLATFDLCVLLGVANLFMAVRYDVTNGGASYKKGWRTDSFSRNELIAGIRQYLINRSGQLNSLRLVGELLSFVRTKTGKAKAKQGCHDDMVFSFGIALQVDELAPSDLEETKKLRPVVQTPGYLEYPKEDLRIKDDPITLEERCWQTAIMKKELMENQDNMFYEEEY